MSRILRDSHCYETKQISSVQSNLRRKVGALSYFEGKVPLILLGHMKMIIFSFSLFLSPICHENLLKVKRNCYIVDFPLDPINFENIESWKGQVQIECEKPIRNQLWLIAFK